MPEPAEHIEDPTRTVLINGRSRAYLECRRIRRRDYFLLERIGSPFRESYLAFDRLAGPRGSFFMVQSLPAGDAAQQLLRVLSRLKNDNLPRAVEWQQNRHQIDVALTWTEGISLADYLQNIREGRRPPVEPVQAVRLVNGLAHAVRDLQGHLQVAHGDIQPANVIVTSHPSRLQLIDFGSAWTIDRTTRRTEGDGHHRCYAAPEVQTAVTPVTLAGDQFPVSVLLYELLTLQLPYGGLGGKAGRPEFTARAADTLVAPQPDFRQLQTVTPVTACSTRRPRPAWSGSKPKRSLPRSQRLAKTLERTFRLVPNYSGTYTDREHLDQVIGWFVKPDSDPKRTGGS